MLVATQLQLERGQIVGIEEESREQVREILASENWPDPPPKIILSYLDGGIAGGQLRPGWRWRQHPRHGQGLHRRGRREGFCYSD